MMIFNPFYFMPPPVFTPLDTKPPKLYDIMNSIVNYDKPITEKVGASQLSKYARTTIFNFEYPLTNKISKEDFETNILNHFIDRRIGLETVSLFRIKLNVRLNEIMPVYNKMFDFLDGWDLFADGERVERTINENKNGSSQSNSTTNSGTNSNSNTIVDNRSSDTPQNELEDVRDGTYVDKYGYTTTSGTDANVSTGSSSNTQSTSDTGYTNEVVTHSPGNKLEIYQKFLAEKNNIYSLIFKDLEELFFQIAD